MHPPRIRDVYERLTFDLTNPLPPNDDERVTKLTYKIFRKHEQ